MSEPLDEFEAKLRKLRPASVSPDLLAGFEAALEARKHRRRIARIFGALAAAAACLLVALWTGEHRGKDAPVAQRILPTHAAPEVAPEPTEWAYLAAAARSPQELDRLLDRDASRLLPPTPDQAATSLQAQ